MAAPARKVDKQIALVLQGGGALGSYQGGVFEALHESGYAPDWVAGISIGAINAAIIAGNAPGERLARLRGFWEGVSAPSATWPELPQSAMGYAAMNQFWRQMQRRSGAASAMLFGQPGFFKPKPLQAWISGTPPTSYYDTADLKATLLRLVDFDRINARHMRFSVGAVNVRTGNFAYFDNAHTKIRPEHVMASGALPPGFPAIEIDGEHYWDGGLVSNTPLQYVLEAMPRHSTLAFQVDVFPARGELPGDLEAVEERRKDIQYSSRTRLGVDSFRYAHDLRRNISKLLEKLPESLHNAPEVVALRKAACQTTMDVVQLVLRAPAPEGSSKDYEFSRATMAARWEQGLADARASVAASPWLVPPPPHVAVRSFDVALGEHS